MENKTTSQTIKDAYKEYLLKEITDESHSLLMDKIKVMLATDWYSLQVRAISELIQETIRAHNKS